MSFKFLNIDLSSLEFESCLGSGCYGGSVCLYRNRKDKRNRRIVVKSIPYDSPEYAYATVMKEHTILSQVNHPRILRYFGFFQTADAWNMITEFAERGNLAEFLHRRREQGMFLGQRVVMAKFRDMAEALQYLHQRKVIHRDLKPGNVLIDADNRLKLADFGIAKICTNVSLDEEMNMTIVGTPLFMAPEVASGKRYDYKSDVWPLGVIFYELCMLEHPFAERFLEGETEERKKFSPPKIDCAQHGFNRDMQTLCEMMIQADPKKRWTLEKILKDDRVIGLMEREIRRYCDDDDDYFDDAEEILRKTCNMCLYERVCVCCHNFPIPPRASRLMHFFRMGQHSQPTLAAIDSHSGFVGRGIFKGKRLVTQW